MRKLGRHTYGLLLPGILLCLSLFGLCYRSTIQPVGRRGGFAKDLRMKARLRCCGLGRFASCGNGDGGDGGAEAEAVTAIAFIEIRDNPSERAHRRLRRTVNAPPAGESPVNQVGWISCRN